VDLQVFARVIWRFRIIVACGIVLGLILACLTVVKVDFDGGVPRVTPPSTTWQSDATLFVTQAGVPWARSVLLDESTQGSQDSQPRFTDPNRFLGLASLYARLVVSDEMKSILVREGPLDGSYRAVQARSEDGTYLPLLAVIGYADTPAKTVALTNRVATAFQAYLRQLQKGNDVPVAQRVEVPFVNRATEATVFDRPSLAKPIFVFLLVMALTIGLAFILESLRPRSAPTSLEAVDREATRHAPSPTEPVRRAKSR
jgi:hypothetical protein